MTTRIVECYASEDAAVHGLSCEERMFNNTNEARLYAKEQQERGYWWAMFDNDLDLIEEGSPQH